eukprot:gb/GECG01013890.1/.p1 GENE.gb/GECG01013890.1/~~gb/GECG01013890.1/.p1  ORF type:complete len:491 (+),score=28.64 gb/GECG01013890.1/:1-1473(+)
MGMNMGQEDAVTIENYRPSKAVEWFNSRSRWTFRLGKAPSEFPGHDSHKQEQWVEGGISWTLAFGALGVCLMFLLTVSYSMTLYARKYADFRAEEREGLVGEKVRSYNRRALIATLTSGSIGLILMGGSMISVRLLSVHFVDALDAMKKTTDAFHSGSQFLNQSNAILCNVTGIVEDIQAGGNISEQLNGQLDIFHSLLRNSIDHSYNASVGATFLSDRLNGIVGTADAAKNTYGVKMAYMYASFAGAFLFGYLLSLIPSTLAACSFKVIVPFNIVGVVVRSTATGAIFMIAILMADYCDKPNTNALKMIERTTLGGQVAYDSFGYYLHSLSSLTGHDGIPFYTQTAQSELGDAIEMFPETAKLVRNSSIPAYLQHEFQGAGKKMNKSCKSIKQARSDTTWQVFHGSWDPFVNNLCGPVFSEALSPLFALELCMAVLAVFTLSFGRSFCTRHPGTCINDIPLYPGEGDNETTHMCRHATSLKSLNYAPVY